jgi:pyruvate dehydrogenase E2 component (dihydrolipoamide acetyltransferase)
MAVVVIMPKQGQSVESCIITEIKKKKGDSVSKGDILFSYETDKASFEEESPADGVVLECLYADGDEVPVLQNMMVIGQPGEDFAALLGESPLNPPQGDLQVAEPVVTSTQPEAIHVTVEAKASPKGEVGGGFISPRAKALAEKEAIDATQLAGSGPKGRVIEKDVLAALENRPKLTPLAKKIAAEEGVQPQGAGSGLAGTAKSTDLLPPPVNTVYGVDYEDKKLSNMRKIIAKSMHASLQNSAQLTHHLGADARRIQALRKKKPRKHSKQVRFQPT